MTNHYIDADKLRRAREWADKMMVQTPVGEEGDDFAAAVVILSLPEPPAPTMETVEWDDDEHHLAEARTDDGGCVVMLTEGVNDDSSPNGQIICSRGGKYPWYYDGSSLTPTGRKFKLVPEVES